MTVPAHQKKPDCIFLPASPVEEQTGGEKLALQSGAKGKKIFTSI
jgi:hypothetical protein